MRDFKELKVWQKAMDLAVRHTGASSLRITRKTSIWFSMTAVVAIIGGEIFAR